MSLQEKFSAPCEEHDPQRLVVSLSVTLRADTPKKPVCRSTAAMRLARASLRRKSVILREI